MSDGLVIAVTIAVCAPLYAVTTWVLAKGAMAWADAIQRTHQARGVGVQADIAEATDAALAKTAADDEERRRVARAAHTPPSDDELAEAILLERAERRMRERIVGHDSEPEYTTLGNEGIPEEEPIPSVGMYR